MREIKVKIGNIYEDEEHFRWEVVQSGLIKELQCVDTPGYTNLLDSRYMRYLGNAKDNPELLEMRD